MRCFYYTVVAHLRRASHHALRRRHGIMQTVDSRQRRLYRRAQVDGEATISVAAGLYGVRAGEKAVKGVVK